MAAAKQIQMSVPKNTSIMRGIMTPPKSSSGRKRKLNTTTTGSPVGSKTGHYPVFSPTSSPNNLLKSPTSSSPTKKRPNLIIQQGASQNNKIFRYLQPKRLLPAFDSQSESLLLMKNNNNNVEDKENNLLELKVALVRLDDDLMPTEHNYCIQHKSPKKFCCNAASEYVVQALENIIINDIQDPCKRLGIAVPPCILNRSCDHDEKIVDVSSAHLDNLLLTMIDADLHVAMIRACCGRLSAKVYPSPTIFHTIFSIMKETADKEAFSLGKSYLKRVLHLFPPCCSQLRNYYLSVLHSGDGKNVDNKVVQWSLRPLEFWEELLNEVESHLESLLNPEQLKEKNNIPGVRKIVKPHRYRSSPSPVKRTSRRKPNIHSDALSSSSSYEEKTPEEIDKDFNDYAAEAMKKKLTRMEALKSMSDQEKTDRLFSRFEILVDMLELDLVFWLSKNPDNNKISDRANCPLIVLALWRPQSDTGFDSIHCRRLFSMYACGWVLKLHPHHLRILGRLIGLIAEVTSASEPNSRNQHPCTGDCCDNLSRKLSDALKNTQLSEVRAKAVKMLKPDWVQMQVSANLLGIPPSISSVDMKTLLEPMTDTNMHLWAYFLEAVMNFYHTKYAVVLLTQGRQGIFQEELLQKHPAHTRRYEINYTGLFQEILAYSKLNNEINCMNVSNVLLQALAL